MKRSKPLVRRRGLRPAKPSMADYQQALDAKRAKSRKKPRKPLRSVSVRQQGRLAIYRVMLEGARQETAPCERCRTVYPWKGLEPHHPFGRGGDNLFRVVMVCCLCHYQIHARPNEAMEAGWLQRPIRGQAEDPNSPRPWKNLITA